MSGDERERERETLTMEEWRREPLQEKVVLQVICDKQSHRSVVLTLKHILQV